MTNVSVGEKSTQPLSTDLGVGGSDACSSSSPWKKGSDPLAGNGFTLKIVCPERV